MENQAVLLKIRIWDIRPVNPKNKSILGDRGIFSDSHQNWVASRWRLDNKIDVSMVKAWEYQSFLNKAAGTCMENLGWGWKGWKFWFQDPKMSYMMNHGVETAHAFRYFDTGKRKAWPGARDAIIHMNELVKMLPIKEEKEIQ